MKFHFFLRVSEGGILRDFGAVFIDEPTGEVNRYHRYAEAVQDRWMETADRKDTKPNGIEVSHCHRFEIPSCIFFF